MPYKYTELPHKWKFKDKIVKMAACLILST